VKELFAAVRPIAPVEIEIGGLYLLRGESTEATTYDNNGYIVGERVIIGQPGRRARATVSFTRGYLGDFDTANVFPRLRQLDRANYYQALLSTNAGGHALSFDYTSYARAHVLRGATVLDVARTRVAGLLRFEHYVRVGPLPAYGFAVAAQRRLPHHLSAAVGFSRIDRNYGTLNSDRYGTGRRAFVSVGLEARPGWIASLQVLRAVDGRSAPGPRTRIEAGLAYDVLKARR
jgi:hypothetical protein